MEMKKEAPQPMTGFLRLSQIIGNRKVNPPIPAIIPISRSTLLAGIKSKRYPLKPIKISERCIAYRVEEARALLESMAKGAQ